MNFMSRTIADVENARAVVAAAVAVAKERLCGARALQRELISKIFYRNI
jgi:hypothetical protein